MILQNLALFHVSFQIDGFMQDRRNFNELAMELRL